MLRYLNMFVLIGIALIAISIIGFATANRFLTEPGQPQNPFGSLIYLGTGVLMLINGIVSVRIAPVPPVSSEASKDSAPAAERVESSVRS